MTSTCRVCAEVKPQFAKVPGGTLIKATQPFERLSVDFKGPLPTTSNNKFLLTVIDEYSRYPFAFPTKDTSAKSVIECLLQIFSLFGTPAFIHSDRGATFQSNELRHFLQSHSIASSRTTPYHPAGNGQIERYNGIIWKTILLLLKSRNMAVSQWEHVLIDALHSIRTLLCTSTNATPHERLMNFARRSTSGHNLPTWLLQPGKVLLKRYVRNSKFEPYVDEVELQDANPYYAHITLPNGKMTTVSTRHLAPINNEALNNLPNDGASDVLTTDPGSSTQHLIPENNELHCDQPNNSMDMNCPVDKGHSEKQFTDDDQNGRVLETAGLRRSKRNIKPPDRLDL